jgi:Queuosine biosynthesis protein QueC
MTWKLCSACVLPENFPGLVLQGGVCNFCRDASGEDIHVKKAQLREEMTREIDRIRGRGRYDCVVAFSGGKDSSYTLLMLVREYGLNCLAVTVDNGFVSERATANCKVITEALGVDFVCYTPSFDFMRKLYVKSATDPDVHTKAAAKRASNVCNSCINLINAYMLKTAVSQGIPMIAGGYLGGQVPPDAIALRIELKPESPARTAQLARAVSAFGPGASRYFELARDVQRADQSVLIVNPMLGTELGEAQIVAAITALGWGRAQDTGLNSSNCQLNDFGIAMHYRQHGYHPYAFELSEQVRAGLMPREEALRRVTDVPDLRRLTPQMRKLQLDVAIS